MYVLVGCDAAPLDAVDSGSNSKPNVYRTTFVQKRKTGNSIYLFTQKTTHKLKLYSTHQLVSSSLTSLFSTNMAISETSTHQLTRNCIKRVNTNHLTKPLHTVD